MAGSSVTVVDHPERSASGIAAARDAGTPTLDELRTLLRTLYLEHATPVMLARLARRLSVSVDPRAGRSTTALVTVTADSELGAVVGSVTRQTHVPDRAVIRLADGAAWSAAADAAFADAGIATKVETGDGGADWERLADDSTTEWLLRWPDARRPAPSYLLDLLVGGEMTSADAVGYRDGDPYRFVPSLHADAAIIRREALQRLAREPLAVVADPMNEAGRERFGWRLVSVGPEAVS
jgi:hypothetical protein